MKIVKKYIMMKLVQTVQHCLRAEIPQLEFLCPSSDSAFLQVRSPASSELILLGRWQEQSTEDKPQRTTLSKGQEKKDDSVGHSGGVVGGSDKCEDTERQKRVSFSEGMVNTDHLS